MPNIAMSVKTGGEMRANKNMMPIPVVFGEINNYQPRSWNQIIISNYLKKQPSRLTNIFRFERKS